MSPTSDEWPVYQPAGAGQLRRLCMIDLARYPDPRVVLETALGKLVLFEMLAEPEPEARAAE